MKKILIIISFVLVLAGSIFFTGCKTSGETQGEFRLVVSVNAGTEGTPSAGTYYYDAGTVINYSYRLQDHYFDLVVKIDNEDVETSGALTITKDHTITSTAKAEYVIMGTWTMEEEYEDGRKFTVTIVFVGDIENGTLTDSDGGTGDYSVPGQNDISFSLEFPNVTYEYTGIFTTVNSMSGSAKRISTVSGELTGAWKAERVSDASVRQSSRGNKGK